MAKEEKLLLFKDLSARLPYHVRVKVWLKDGTTEEGALDLEHNYGDVLRDAFYYKEIVDIKPYLRPMSSMTEEERKEYWDITSVSNHCAAIDWLNAHHFDYRGLIPKGKAIDITAGYNPYERKWLNASDLQTYISVEGRNLIHISEIINNARNFVSALWRTIEHGPNVIDVQVPSNFNTVVIDIQVRRGFISIEIGKSKVGFFTDFDDGINEESDGIETDFRSVPEQILKLLKEE